MTGGCLTRLESLGSYTPDQAIPKTMDAYGAVFAEVAVDADLGLVRVRRMVAVYDAGRIISPKLADSQAIGVKGLGEVVIVGVAPAIANTVFNATGRRPRELSITIESLL